MIPYVWVPSQQAVVHLLVRDTLIFSCAVKGGYRGGAHVPHEHLNSLKALLYETRAVSKNSRCPAYMLSLSLLKSELARQSVQIAEPNIEPPCTQVLILKLDP